MDQSAEFRQNVMGMTSSCYSLYESLFFLLILFGSFSPTSFLGGDFFLLNFSFACPLHKSQI